MDEISVEYKSSALILKQMSEKKGSLKSLISQTSHNKNIKLVYALVIKVLKNIKTIQFIIESTNIENEINIERHLIEILIAELIYGKGLNHIKNIDYVQQILCYENRFRKLMKTSFKKQDDEFIVRYIRINLIKTTIKKVIKKLIKRGFEKVDYDYESINFETFKELVYNLNDSQFIIDYHFRTELLVFNINSTKKIQNLQLFKKSKIVMQDKSSLLAIECMNLKNGLKILDVCSAPGMKTSAIASRLNNDCQIISIDINNERLNEMKTLINKMGVTCCCDIKCIDFTNMIPKQIGPIDVILLDPSCSGSGMRQRHEYDANIHKDKARICKLAAFQTKMLCHAMRFDAKCIVYSTCSLSLMENENVIKSALNESEFGENYGVVDAMPEWEMRGKGDYYFADKCLRSDSQTFLTNGFFVCVLNRINSNH